MTKKVAFDVLATLVLVLASMSMGLVSVVAMDEQGMLSNDQTSTALYLFQSHSGNFWQVNADDAATLSGEVGFISMEWDVYTDYTFATLYKVEAGSSFNIYVPCSQENSCTSKYYNNPKLLGVSEMGNVAILDNQTNLVNYYPWNWYSIPKGGQCPEGEPIGYERCGFLPPCAVKSVKRSCLHSQQGWTKGMNEDDLFTLFPIFQTAFLSNDTSNGGCPDETGGEYPICEDADRILAEFFAPSQSAPNYLKKQTKKSEIKRDSVKVQESVANPYLSVNRQSSSICEITSTNGKGVCTSLLSLPVDLSNYKEDVITAGDGGNFFVHLVGIGTPNLIIGYNIAKKEMIYNHTTSYEFTWFAVDMADNTITGLLYSYVDFEYGAYSIEIVNIDLSTSIPTNLGGVYNNTYTITKAALDSTNNVVRFTGDGSYLGLLNVISYQINTANEVAFPILAINQQFETIAYNSLTDTHYIYGEIGVGSCGFTALNVELIQPQGPFFSTVQCLEPVGDSMDSLNGYWTVCSTASGEEGHTVVTIDLSTGKILQDFKIPSGCNSAVYAN